MVEFFHKKLHAIPYDNSIGETQSNIENLNLVKIVLCLILYFLVIKKTFEGEGQ
jgi:hypothetical protein